MGKRKISGTVDEDILAEFDNDAALSAQVNDALRDEARRRRHNRALTAYLDGLTRRDGPLTDAEEAEVRKCMRILEGLA